MKTSYNIDQAIATLVENQCGPNASARERYLHRETLLSLVRLAVAEHAMNLQKDLDKTIGILQDCEHA